MLRRLAVFVGVACVTVSAPRAADHGDSPAAAASPRTDLNDLYAWMQDSRVNLAMTAYRDVPPATGFSPSAQYVFHVTRHAAYGMPATGETLVLCNFAPNGRGQCWVGPASGGTPVDYVGDLQPDLVEGRTSASGLLKVFIGTRNDPFFFNLEGFAAVAETVTSALASLTLNAQSCPALSATTAEYLRTQLASGRYAPGGTPPPPTDAFAGENVLSIVVQVDKSLVSDADHPVIGVWASTNML